MTTLFYNNTKRFFRNNHISKENVLKEESKIKDLLRMCTSLLLTSLKHVFVLHHSYRWTYQIFPIVEQLCFHQHT